MVGPLLDRATIKKDCDLKYPYLIVLLNKELQNARLIYDQQMYQFKMTGKSINS